MLRALQYTIVVTLILLTLVTLNALSLSYRLPSIHGLQPLSRAVHQISHTTKEIIEDSISRVFPSSVDSSNLNIALDARLPLEERIASVLALKELSLSESAETLSEIAASPIRMAIGNHRFYRDEFAVRAAALEALVRIDESEKALIYVNRIAAKLDDRLLRERLGIVRKALVLKDEDYIRRQDLLYFKKLASQRESRLSE